MERFLIIAAIVLAAILWPQTALLVISYLAKCFEVVLQLIVGVGSICIVYKLIYDKEDNDNER